MAIQRYLARYAETDSLKIAQSLVSSEFEFSSLTRTLVIPVYAESPQNLVSLTNCECVTNTLIILVFNCPSNTTVAAAKKTRLCCQGICERYSAVALAIEGGKQVHVAELDRNSILLLLDLTQESAWLPPKQGVGLARKIGMDTAVAISQQSNLSFDWLHCTDADVHLPQDYFNASESVKGAVALTYPFQHVPEPGLETAVALYDFSLRYYVDRLAWAGSPYAFHTIGSTLAVNLEAYAKVRGIPRKSGGEDFYLLNKIAKLGRIAVPPASPIKIIGRASLRVPFGTGPAVTNIKSLPRPLKDYPYYHPETFVVLKLVLEVMRDIRRRVSDNEGAIYHHFQESLKEKLAIEKRDRENIEAICEAIETLDFKGAFRHLYRYRTDEKQFIHHFNIWFDGFRTLKLVHALRERVFPEITLEEVLTQGHNLDFKLSEYGRRILASGTNKPVLFS